MHYTLLGIMLLTASSLFSTPAWAEDKELTQEYRIKSAYLYHFTKFIHWPEDTFTNNQPLHLCVQDNQAFSDFLQAINSIKKSDSTNHSILVKNITDPEETKQCHILYLTQIKDPPPSSPCQCLIIGDTPEHQACGSAINFYQDNNRIRFEVYLQRLKDHNLSMSSELLKLARINNTDHKNQK